MKTINIEIRDPTALNDLDFIDTKDKRFWKRGEEHESMIEIHNQKNNLTLRFTIYRGKDALERWLVENLNIWPHPNCYKKDWSIEKEQRREEEYKRILNDISRNSRCIT